MAPIPFVLLQQHVTSKLRENLPAHLTYHSLAHTLDVMEQAQKIAVSEGITSPEDLLLLKVAALYHDSGFTISEQDHEALGCEIVRQELPQFGFTAQQIEKTCHLIHATKIPQSPHTLLEKVLCDADLDYLGRDDFQETAGKLYQELKHSKKLSSEEEWNMLQLRFLESHRYFTRTARQKREKQKQAHLQALKATVNQVL